jgi:hypothetical protein
MYSTLFENQKIQIFRAAVVTNNTRKKSDTDIHHGKAPESTVGPGRNPN